MIAQAVKDAKPDAEVDAIGKPKRRRRSRSAVEAAKCAAREDLGTTGAEGEGRGENAAPSGDIARK